MKKLTEKILVILILFSLVGMIFISDAVYASNLIEQSNAQIVNKTFLNIY